jgi:hypothetical protein
VCTGVCGVNFFMGEIQMRNIKGFILGLVVGLALAVSSIGFAQNATQSDPAKEKQSCCSASSCCSGDSCATKHAAMKHDAMKHADMSKDHASKDGCCCCCGDSCDMKMKETQVNDAKKQG